MMEPLAPGTEDEPPSVTFSAATKQEKERERLLSIKALLPKRGPGSSFELKLTNVFELKYINGAEHWFCNACQCPVMGRAFYHETGKRHKLALGKQPPDEHYSSNTTENDDHGIQVAPGEPVPPGFEGQVEKVALIQERLDNFTVGPLLALEYLLELRDYDVTKEPTYLCILCDKKGDPRTVLTHLASYRHILEYLKKHFPTCYRALAPYMTKQYKRNWQTALHEIAEAIEKKFGRLKPMPVEASKFEQEQFYYLQMIASGRHFSELSGHTFEELVNIEELTKIHEDEDASVPVPSNKKRSPSPPVVANPIKKINKLSTSTTTSSNAISSSVVGHRRRSLSSVSSITSSDMSDFDDKTAKKPQRKSRSPSPRYRNRSRSPYSRRYDRRDRSPPPRYHRERERERDNVMPWEKSNYRRPRSDFVLDNRSKNKTDKMAEFKKLCVAIDNDMDRVLKNHKKNPEKHPQYNDEWKKFWNRRYKELQAENKDVSSHDFKPEWIEYWNKRMIELHQDEVKIKKDALKKRLGIEDPPPISFKISTKKKYDNYSPSPSQKPIPPSALPDNDPEVIVIDDRDDESKGSKRSHSPWEEEPTIRRNRESVKKSLTKSRSRSPKRRSRTPRKNSISPRRSHSPSRYSRSPRRLSRSPKRSRSPWRYDRSPPPHREWDDYKRRDREREYRGRERIRVVSELPWERKPYRDVSDYYKPPAVMRDVTREPVITPKVAPISTVEEPEDCEINVVAVLRLLTALEEKLGSLGPKIIDLLANALAMEKNEANSSENLLDNEINCVLFETVKEKLKGQLLAGLVEIHQEKAFKNAIKKIASLIHLAGERKKEREKLNPKVDPVKVPGIGTVDKAAIAKQIANALVLQGKTDVTQSELEQLINAVVGMAEASQKSNKPISTASFLEEISKASTSKEKIPLKPESPQSLPESDTPKIEKSTPSMEGLSDSDLQTLLQNFKDLSTEEQHGLINYLKKLEAQEPERVERLRKFVNLDNSKNQSDKNDNKNEIPLLHGRESPFSNRIGSLNPENQRKGEDQSNNPSFIESDEEDYTFEDVVKAASKNVKQQEMEKEREIVQESMKFERETLQISSSIDTTPPVSSTPSISTANLSSLFGFDFNNRDFAKTLNSLPVNMASLANIVGSVQNLTKNQQQPPPNPIPPVQYPTNTQPQLHSQKLLQPPIQPRSNYDLEPPQSRSNYNLDQPIRSIFAPFQQQSIPQQSQQQQNQSIPPFRQNVGYPNINMNDNRNKSIYPPSSNYGGGFYDRDQPPQQVKKNDSNLRFGSSSSSSGIGGGGGSIGGGGLGLGPGPSSLLGERFLPPQDQWRGGGGGGTLPPPHRPQQQSSLSVNKFQNNSNRNNYRW